MTVFADDGLTVIFDKNLHRLKEKAEDFIDTAVTWTSRAGLQIHTGKTDLMYIGSARNHAPTLCLNNTTLEYVDKLKFLGVTIDRWNTYEKHINNKIKYAKLLLTRAACLHGREWGPKAQVIKWTYESVIRPALSYGSIVWANKLRCKQKRKLNSINRLALLCMASCRKGTPTAGLEIILDLPPLELVIEELTLKTHMRLEISGTLQGHRLFWQNKADRLGLKHEDFDRYSGRYLCKNFEIVTKECLEYHESDIHVYTDGSKTSSGTGLGVVIQREGQPDILFSERTPEGSTVFEAELTAINFAAEQLTRMKTKGQNVVIFSDSLSSLHTISRSKVTTSLASGTIYKLQNLSRKNKVTLQWVKAHVGTPGNELADSLAKTGTRLWGPTRFKFMPSHRRCGQVIRDNTLKTWGQKWAAHTECRQTKNWFPKRDARKSHLMLKYGRLTLNEMVRFVTGFNYLNYHNHNMGKSDTDMCRLCNEGVEETLHLVKDCPELNSLSREIFGPWGISPGTWTPKGLKTFVTHPKVMMLLADDHDITAS
jgi:ribonuclease HI